MMQTEMIHIKPSEARSLYKQYQEHVHWKEDVDKEIRAAYRLLSQGKLVIKALASIAAAGSNDFGFPKLAIARADSRQSECRVWKSGRFQIADIEAGFYSRNRNRIFSFPEGTIKNPPAKLEKAWQTEERRAVVPIVPSNLRPQHKLHNYHILWEAEWSRVVPRDPFLLRRLGKGDLWLVLAMWDLTEVERAALQSRL